MQEPLAYFLTWTTYGTWLPGDERGWIDDGNNEIQTGNPALIQFAQDQLSESPCVLTPHQRKIVEQTIRDHCAYRKWTLIALNCRTNHVHVVVNAPVHPNVIEQQFKAWCSRRLNEDMPAQRRQHWWTRHGGTRYINTEEELENVVEYVVNGQ